MSESQRDDRIKKLNNLKAAGIDPYPPGPFDRESFSSVLQKELGTRVQVAGRIMLRREMGNLIFLTLQEGMDRLQILISKRELEGQDFKLWAKNLDLGDLLHIQGERFETKTKEPSVLARKITLVSKALQPLPDKHKGLQDDDERLRKRYLDLMLNSESRDIVIKRDRFWNSMRSFFKERDFLEVFTPVLETTTGGADARPFVTHHNAMDMEVFLRISMGELWQKRLLVAGFDKTFEIGRQFRNEGMDAEHLNDYQQMEFYWAYADYRRGMQLVQDMYRHVAQETFGTLQFNIRGFQIDLGAEWRVYSYVETVAEMTGINALTATLPEIQAKLNELRVQYDPKGFNMARAVDSLWKHCRKQIAGPAFLVDEPALISPLAKRMPDKPELTQRFHVILAGSEIGNGYSELNDPLDQAQRFEDQDRLRKGGDEEAQMNDGDFVEALEHGMPNACGFGVSERLLWFLLDKPGRECQTFPLIKPRSGQ